MTEKAARRSPIASSLMASVCQHLRRTAAGARLVGRGSVRGGRRPQGEGSAGKLGFTVDKNHGATIDRATVMELEGLTSLTDSSTWPWPFQEGSRTRTRSPAPPRARGGIWDWLFPFLAGGGGGVCVCVLFRFPPLLFSFFSVVPVTLLVSSRFSSSRLQRSAQGAIQPRLLRRFVAPGGGPG